MLFFHILVKSPLNLHRTLSVSKLEKIEMAYEWYILIKCPLCTEMTHVAKYTDCVRISWANQKYHIWCIQWLEWTDRCWFFFIINGRTCSSRCWSHYIVEFKDVVKRYFLGYDTRTQSVVIGNINNDGMLDIAGYVEILLQTCQFYFRKNIHITNEQRKSKATFQTLF